MFGLPDSEPSRVAVTVAGNDELLLITQTPATGMPTSALAMAIGTHATAVDLAEGAHALHLLAVDFAGNASASAAMPELTVPTEQSGCSAGSQQSGWLIVGLVVLGIRRKRKSPCVGPAR